VQGRKKVVIDVTRLAIRLWQGRLPTGVDKVSLAYIAHFKHIALAKLSWKGFSTILPQAVASELFGKFLRWNTEDRREFHRFILKVTVVPRSNAAARNSWLFHTGHSGLENPAYSRGLSSRALRPIFFLHDLIPITHPEFCRAGEADKHRLRIGHMLRWGRGLIANSQQTAESLKEYARSASLALPPVLTAPLAAEVWPAGTIEPATNAPYFVALSTVEPRKNYALLLALWSSIIAEQGALAPELVIVGQAGWESPDLLAALNNRDAWGGKLRWLQECDTAELAGWAKGARALLFPSHAEGYGLPVAEALASGVPVIASDLPAIREISSDVPLLLKPSDVAAWRAAVLDFARPDSVLRAKQIEKMAGLKLSTWAEHFSAVDDFLLSLGEFAS
jgi:glycosyltransferase involved in cell wall biosynthesis